MWAAREYPVRVISEEKVRKFLTLTSGWRGLYSKKSKRGVLPPSQCNTRRFAIALSFLSLNHLPETKALVLDGKWWLLEIQSVIGKDHMVKFWNSFFNSSLFSIGEISTSKEKLHKRLREGCRERVGGNLHENTNTTARPFLVCPN